MKPDKDKDPKTSSAPKKPNGKVFDVSRPGKTPAAPTSKPVISGHKPEAQAAQITVSGIGEAQPLLNRRKIEIMPLGDVKAKPAEASKAEEKPSGQSVASAQPTKQEAEGLGTAALDAVAGPPTLVSKPSEPSSPATPPKLNMGQLVGSGTEAAKPVEPPAEAKPTPEANSVSEVSPSVKTEPAISEKELPAESSSMPEVEPVEKTEEKEEPAPEPVIEPLFDDSGSIVVSNHEHHHRNHGLKVFLLLLLILLLAAAALDILLDLEMLNIEGIPRTDLL